jgi:hypothetical protein
VLVVGDLPPGVRENDGVIVAPPLIRLAMTNSCSGIGTTKLARCPNLTHRMVQTRAALT